MDAVSTVELKPWYHRKTAPVKAKSGYGTPAIYYREDHGLVTEICLGERYAHISPGLLFMNEQYRGCYSDNWHGGPSGSLTDMVRWVSDAEHPGYGHDLWMIDGDPYEEKVTRESARRMRKESGRVNDEDPLVAFFYLLGRDHLPIGVIEEVLGKVPEDEAEFTNGWLAKWAKDAAKRMS